MSDRTVYITRTAILLAITLVFQMLRVVIQPVLGPGHIFVVGSLVNLALIVSVGQVGLIAGLLISIMTPIVAFMQGHIPPIPPIAALVATGNAVLVAIFYALKAKNMQLGVVAGAAAKTVVMYGGLTLLMEVLNLNPVVARTLAFGFGWPQLVTAIVGGYAAIIVLKVLEKSGIKQ